MILSNEAPVGEKGEPVKGTLRLVRKTEQGGSAGVQSELIAEKKDLTLQPGKNIIAFDSQLDRSGIFATEAVFIPDDRNDDLIEQNNRASAFTRVQGRGKVLLIEDIDGRGEFSHLADRLRANSIEVAVTDTTRLFNSAAELLQYDAVILANIPRSSGIGDSEEGVAGFSDAQIKLLVDNCEKMGCGIIMLGGERAFGAGGWSNTLLEEAMPVEFQIKNDKAQAVGALAMVMHACEMPQGNHWQIKIGEAALEVLGPADYCGVVQYDFNTGVVNGLGKI